MQCSKCQRDAIVFQPYSGLHLCGQHLTADVEAKAKKQIRAQGGLKPGDHIAILLSQDPNSRALLYFLKHLTAQRRDIRITAIAIQDGTGTLIDISRAKRFAECLDTEFLIVSLPEESDNRAECSEENRDMASLPVSRISHSFRLDRFAHLHGITKIAWGLCLDAAAAVVLGFIIRGDGESLVRGNSYQDLLPRICPFISVTAGEISLYAAFCGCGDEQTIHPEQGDELQKDMITMLDNYTNNHPATKYALLNMGENLGGPERGIAGLIQTCALYGEYPRGCCNNSPIPYEVTNGTR
jgi:tRNA(Ile)-lysidine synthase TilS/MesJ